MFKFSNLEFKSSVENFINDYFCENNYYIRVIFLPISYLSFLKNVNNLTLVTNILKMIIILFALIGFILESCYS